MTEASQSQALDKPTTAAQNSGEFFSGVCASYEEFKERFEDAEASLIAARDAKGNTLTPQFERNNLCISHRDYVDRLFQERRASFGKDQPIIEDIPTQALGATATGII